MRYWDASALIPLIVAEEASTRIRRLFRDDPMIVTWAWTRVEIASAVERRAREGSLSRRMRAECLERFGRLADQWDEVVDVAAVRIRAMQVLARQSVRAADAAQLGAAMLLSEDDHASTEFVCLDQKLALAAEREGFRVVG